ncbi:unnamed protein product [Bursaphelenchus xylophilus]|uniref:(pine wood nematode) hypothetical protein n=1 Tax=Bursaphelenchus xylophilus TaxID=6326 RepID=A0A1I7SAR4_BURXY|nr:unnamed protein product [Bursaphelenchus xylophilus]CAG9126859.1 unnamed protein product [Bursaphelenchus xylophilus]
MSNNRSVNYQTHLFNYQLEQINNRLTQLSTLVVFLMAGLSLFLFLLAVLLGFCLWIQWRKRKRWTRMGFYRRDSILQQHLLKTDQNNKD